MIVVMMETFVFRDTRNYKRDLFPLSEPSYRGRGFGKEATLIMMFYGKNA